MMENATSRSLYTLAESVGDKLAEQGLLLATAESCTGGGVAHAVTAVAGSSGWFDRGFVVYTNRAKQEMLSVREETLNTYGAVSEQAAREMAAGALAASQADISVAITGIAGPAGGTADKPVGTVCFAWHQKQGQSRSQRCQLNGDRESVRDQSIHIALEGVLSLLDE